MEPVIEKKKRKWGAVTGVLFLLASKFKILLPLLKVFKLHTVLSMFLSIGAYALIYGWEFAFVLVYLIFIHESGHLWAAKRVGIPTTPAVFIPFVGAFIGMKEEPKNAKDEAFMAYMGPLWGLVSFLPAIPLYFYTEHHVWALMIALGSLINLFNLIPVSPLDGGRIVSVISTRFWAIGLVLLGVFAFISKSGVAIMMVIFGVISLLDLRQKRIRAEQLDFQLGRLSLYEQSLRSKIERYGYHPLSMLKIKKECEEHIIRIETNEELVDKKKKQGELELHQLFQKVITRLESEYVVTEEEGTNFTSLPTIPTTFLEVEEARENWSIEREKIKGYYVAETKVKWLYFSLYVGLIMVLSILAYWGNTILPSAL